MILCLYFVIFLTANERPALPTQARKTLINQSSGLYSVFKKMILKTDQETYNEDWYKENTPKKNQLTGDISDFGKDIQTVIKKHHFTIYETPFNVQGLPIIYPSKGTGVNIGLRLNFYNLQYVDPYKYNLSVQYWTSDRERAKHKVKLDVPYFFNSNWRLITYAYYNHNISNSYFGTGNKDLLDVTLLNPHSSNIPNSRIYNKYKSKEPGAGIELRRKIYQNLSLFSGLEFMDYNISYIEETEQNYLKENNPYGIEGGQVNFYKLGFLYDTSNYPTNPDQGNKFILTYSSFFGTYAFHGLNFSWSYFYTVSKYLTIASRFMVQQFFGQVPFFALSYFVSDDVYKGLGGEDVLRGEFGSRYIDKFKVAEQIEFRINFYTDEIQKQLIKINLVPFIDLGAVSNNAAEFDFNNTRFSYGSSLRLIWNKNFLVNFSFGFSKHAWTTYLSFGENF